ncbi:4-coumarate--CoA ligase 1-like isoform X2 [Leguminivora glycinivorella]|uniref:4-coumarate--CoA ligase 1-like isoform X2 n=1 Tax=Leguminivora glycinivorella TaxID=1035111 RepID=UPI00200BBA11|nr:4-coumarate--CoA ligase 1-like isoform X2 [Leguminivora glycinivorella]
MSQAEQLDGVFFFVCECAETKKSYTYEQLQRNTAIFATSLLKKLGLKPGDTVAIMLPNCPEFVVTALGIVQAGCTMTTINPIYKELELTHQLSLTSPKLIVTTSQCYDTIIKAMQNANLDMKIIIKDSSETPIPNGTTRFREVAENGEIDNALLEKVEKRKPDDVAVIPFSSGTTGMPKGVEITHRNVIAAIEIMDEERNCYPMLATDSFQDVVPCILPFFHIYGLVINLLGHLSKGCKLITMTTFSTGLFLDILKNQKASLLYIVPPIAVLLGKHPDVTKDHLKHVRRITSGAAPLSASDVQLVMDKSNGNLAFGQGYGATEMTSLTTASLIGSTPDFAASGVLMSNIEMKFVDPLTGNPVPAGKPGEMYIRGPVVMKGYHKNEQATADSLTEDGFYKTGDLGYYDKNEGLYVTDRIKELIKVKGLQVMPAELEGILRSHPAVADAAVIGIPHEFYGEAPRAFVIPKRGFKLSEEELQGFVAEKVAPYKKIEEVVFVNDIPKTNTGKILRRELKKMYA